MRHGNKSKNDSDSSPASEKPYIPDVSCKHPGGRPPKFTTEKELQDKIDEYFYYCEHRQKEITSEEGDVFMVSCPEPKTILGLCLWIGVDRATLLSMQKKVQFLNTITRAKAICEHDAELRLFAVPNPRGVMFALQNGFGWKEKSDVTSDDKPIAPAAPWFYAPPPPKDIAAWAKWHAEYEKARAAK